MLNFAQTHQQYNEIFNIKIEDDIDDISQHIAAEDGISAGNSDLELLSIKCEEQEGTHFFPYEGITTQFPENPDQNMLSIYGSAFGNNSTGDQSLANIQPSFDYPLANYDSANHQKYGLTISDCRNNLNWHHPNGALFRESNERLSLHIHNIGTQCSTEIESQSIRFTSPQTDIVLYVSGLDHIVPEPLRKPLFEKPVEKVIESTPQPDIPVFQLTDAHVSEPSKRRRCNRTKNISLLKSESTSEWECTPCNRMFRNRGGLLQHNNTHHSGDKPFVCKVCGKRYSDETTKKQHEKRHSVADKPYKCDSCSKQYIHPNDLKRHVDLHHKVAPFTCKYCGKAFDRHDHVRDHETSHENGTVKRNRKIKYNKKIDEE